MHYTFPEIRHLDQVLEAIQGVEGFIVAQRDWGTVVNYVQMGPDMFPEVHTAGGSARMREKATLHKAIRRECRGLIFNTHGRLISRPLQKFFNVGERRETLPENIDLGRSHVILEKLDGSMIRPVPMDDGSYRLGTKMGVTDVALQAERYLARQPNIDRFIQGALGEAYTPIFEWCSRQQRIVIDYPQDKLVLTAVRHVYSGEYMTYQMMQELAGEYGLDLVRAYDGTVENMQRLMEETRALEDQEGWVIRWDDGHMVKLKGDAYVRIHRAKDALIQEKGLIEMMLDEKLDDVKSFLPQEDLNRVETYERAFWQGVDRTAKVWKMTNSVIRREYGNDRKAFALSKRADSIYKTGADDLDPHLKSAVFRAWDQDWTLVEWRQAVVDVIAKNTGTATKVDAVRALWGDAKWKIENKEINDD